MATTLVYTAIAMTALTGICALAVDWGRVQLAKTELAKAVDAAARAGAASVGSGATAARNAAIAAAAYNTVDGQALVLTSADILVGKWDSTTKTLDTASSSPDAVQVTGYRNSSRGNAIQLVFGKVIGLANVNVSASATARYGSDIPYGIIGLDNITTRRDLFAASYSSSVMTTPTHASYYSNCLVETNGTLYGSSSGNDVFGDATYGPSGGGDPGVTLWGTRTYLSTNITGPTVSASSVTNPGGVSANPTLADNTTYTWPGGTYYFTNLYMYNGVKINFTGPAVVYLDGDMYMHDNNAITASSSVPGNLQIYQTAGNAWDVHNTNSFYAQIVCPGVDMIFNDNCNIYGSVIGKSLTFHDKMDIYLDEVLQTTSQSNYVKIVK